MTKSMLFFIAVLIVALDAGPLLASEERQYVGTTAVETPGSLGLLAMHELCDADFPKARMCSTADIVRNGGNGAPLPAGAAWIRPSPVAFIKPGTNVLLLDASGKISSFLLGTGDLTCRQWSSSLASDAGMIFGNFGFNADECGDPLPVACCRKRKGR